MTRGLSQRWLNRYAWLTAAATLVLICIGGLVTSKGAGMAVPDWPNTYGYNLFLFPVSQWVGGILYEHTHRLMGALVGLLTAGLAVWLWVRETHGRARAVGVSLMVLAVALLGARAMPVYVALAALALPVIAWGLYRFARDPSSLRWLGVTALAAVVLQGVLGGLRVAWLADEIGVFHGMLAQSFLVLTGAIALLTTRGWREAPRDGAGRAVRGTLLLATALVFVQLGLGAAMRHRHAGLAVPDFPLAYGRVWPRTDAAAVQRYNQQRLEVVAAHPIAQADVWLHMAHRVGAGAVVAAVTLAFVRARRRLPPGHVVRRGAAVWLGLVLAQFALGGITVWTNKAADIATAHVAVGSLILLTGGLLCAGAWRRAFQEPALTPSLSRATGEGARRAGEGGATRFMSTEHRRQAEREREAAPPVGTSGTRKSVVAVFMELVKARLTGLVLVTAGVGFCVGARGNFDLTLLLHTLVGTGLLACGASALNQFLERDLDALMLRTQDRPLPSGRVTPNFALGFGGACALAGLAWLTFLTTLEAGALGAITVVLYLFLYTPLKRVSTLNTVVGAVPGALPPLIGWAAATGDLGVGGWSLFALQFFWQIPHFMAIAWLYRDDYARAGLKMLPVVEPSGERTGLQSISHSLGLLAVSLSPVVLGLAGAAYLAVAMVLGLAMLVLAVRFARRLDRSAARWLFLASVTYLPVVLALLAFDAPR